MQHVDTIKNGTRRVIFATMALLLISVSAPTPVYMSAGAADCNPVAAAPTGIQAPTGSDAHTYKYNECTGLWENEHYTWNPSTKARVAKNPAPYTYNESTNRWDSSRWLYSPAAEGWFQSKFSVDEPPAGAERIGAPKPKTVEPPTTPTPDSTGNSNTVNNSANVNSTTDATVNNTIDSQAQSGNTSVNSNTNGGSASSGNAQAIANVMNMLQSSYGAGEIATFTTDINGDVQGDLLIDPSFFQPSANVNKINNDVDITVANNGTINNDIDLTAKSGNASVTKNTNAGDAKTGDASAIANVVNMMNSMIAANQSFMGTININGNFNGNILMPENFYDQLLASNAPAENVAVSQETINKLSGNLSNNTNITNNVDSTASTGSATVKDNTTAGGATTGKANTNVEIFNLTNNQITAGNSMLVFVNVTGKWVGLIMDAPAGSTAAAFGGGVTNHTTNNTAVNAANNGKISNDIKVAAASGNATVASNTHGGSATSGNANTAVNVANISNSGINLTGWFGILFINVFGNWNGNFGVATSMPPAGAGGRGGEGGATAPATNTPAVFGFTPKTSNTSSNEAANGSQASTDNSARTLASVVNDVLGASTETSAAQSPSKVAADGGRNGIGLMIAGAALVALALAMVAADNRFGRATNRR